MNNTKKSTISGAFCLSLALGLGAASASADELAQVPPTPTPPAPAPAAAPPAGAAPGAPPAPAAPTSPLIAPSITGPLTIQLPPPKYTIPYIGDIYVDGIGSGFAQWSNNLFPGQHFWQGDLNNGQVFVQKTDGLFQFYAQAGAYGISSLGSTYIPASQATIGNNTPFGNLWGWFPQGFVKIAPTDSFSVQGGKLPTLIGAEYTFSFENINIERGLLWNQEPAVSKGVQANYTIGPVATSVSFTDGFDSGVWNWVTGAVTYTLNSANSFEFVGGGNVSGTNINTLRTPILQNNSQIYNLIYTYNNDPWIIQPYFQATHVPTNSHAGITADASSYGFALLANYDVGSLTNLGINLAGVNLGGRFEYINTTGGNNILYGPGSAAYSFTVTPSYQYKYFFARAEFSFVKANSITLGDAFGSAGTKDTQTRVVFEGGILF
jgi:hypothetical protein